MAESENMYSPPEPNETILINQEGISMRKQRVVSCALTAAFVASMISIGPEKLTKTYTDELVNNGCYVTY